MGWSRYAHTIRIFVLNSGLFYIQPNERTIQLMDRITDRLMREQVWDQAVFNEEIFFPTHEGYNGSHISVSIPDVISIWFLTSCKANFLGCSFV